MPARICALFIGVVLRHPVIILQLSFKAVSTWIVWADLLYIGHAYSPAEKHNVRADVLKVWEFAPQSDPISLRRMLILADVLSFVLTQ